MRKIALRPWDVLESCFVGVERSFISCAEMTLPELNDGDNQIREGLRAW